MSYNMFKQAWPVAKADGKMLTERKNKMQSSCATTLYTQARHCTLKHRRPSQVVYLGGLSSWCQEVGQWFQTF